MIIFNIIIAIILVFAGFALGSEEDIVSAKRKYEKERVIWQQGYNAGWSDAIKTKKNLEGRDQWNIGSDGIWYSSELTQEQKVHGQSSEKTEP